MMKTFQLAKEGPYGTAKKIAPMTTETVKNQLNCFQTSGSADEPVEAQGILPDISNFKVKVKFKNHRINAIDVEQVKIRKHDF